MPSDRISDEHLGLLERSLDAIDSEYTPTCRSAPYGSGCPGATDESIDFWRRAADAVPAMIAELRERRADDPSDDDRDALALAQGDIVRAINPVADDGCTCGVCCKRRRAVALLDKLLARGSK